MSMDKETFDILMHAKEVKLGIPISKDGFVSQWELIGGIPTNEPIYSDRRRKGVNYSSFGVTRDIVPKKDRN